MPVSVSAILHLLASASQARFKLFEPDEAAEHGWTFDQVWRAVVLGALVFALAFGAVALTKVYDRTASVWLANAVIVGLVIRAPRSHWATLLAIAFGANLGANIANDDPLLRAALLAAINIVESAIVILLMGRRFEQTSLFDDGKVISRFLLYAGVVGPLAAATLAAASLALTGGAPFLTTLIGWYVADALGLLTLGALLLAVPTRRVRVTGGEWLGGVACAVLAGLVTMAAFGQDQAPLLFTVAPVLMIAALRAPLIGAMAAVTLCAGIAILATMVGDGPIANADLDPTRQLYVLQGFIASMLFVVLPVRALAGERDRLGGVVARSEQLFSRIAEASPSGTIHFDPLGRPSFANHRWTLLTGLDRAALDGDRWLDAIAPADRSAASSLWSRARATLEPCTGEFRFCKNGAPAGHAELNLYPEVEDGKILGFVVRLTDVTARRLAEDALQEREARYRLVTENAQDVILRLGLDGRPLYVSGASLRVTGYAPVELVGRPLGELIHSEDAPRFNRNLARMAEGVIEPSVEFRLRHRDGHYSWFESSQRVLFAADGNAIELVASLRDIDLRRRSEATAAVAAAQLRETNRLLLLAEELAGVGHWHFDPNAHELDYSPQINRILKQKRDDRLRVGGILAVVHDDDRRTLLAALARTRRTHGTAECAIRLKARDGLRHVRLVAQAEYHGAKFAGWFGVVGDVTDKVIADTALIDALDAAQAAAVAKSHFLATMSHEIRTPMTGVLGMIELLRDDPLPAERERFFATLKQSADVLMAVLDNVLDFSKIDGGALQLEASDFDLETVAMATLDLFDNAASRKGLLVAYESDYHARPQVRGDAVRLQQVLSNLLSNAIKFTEQGEIRLTVSATPAGVGRSRYRFKVSDSGIGIDAAEMETLFDPFIQADASTSRRFGGTGLGLAISRRLVQAMGGEISVRSRPGEGSTFAFELTLEDGVAVASPCPPAAPLLPSAHPLDVLIAEDNPVNQMLIAAIMRRMGHRTTVVENGREAVEAAAAKFYDVILMDMQMPEMDGLAATRAIRASGGPCATTAIIALTADASPERRRFYDGAGLTDFLTKPIDRRALAERLAQVAPLLPAVVTPPPTSAVFDPERISELRSAVGDSRFEALLGLLLVECRERPLHLHDAQRRGDLAAIHAEGHSLRGSAISIGATALGQAAQQLEAVSSVALAEPLIAALEDCAQATLAAVQRLLAVATVGDEPGRPGTLPGALPADRATR